MSYFLDTNMCIYFIKGMYPQLREQLSRHSPQDIKISSIVKAELLYGAEKSVRRDANISNVNNFLSPMEVIAFDDEAAKCYGFIRARLEREGRPIGLNDLLIAATVITKRGILITNNTKEFCRIPELQLGNWI